jgi:DNA-binding response OmpR family regulator
VSTILLVDDEPLLRSVLCEYLKFAGHRVIECKDGDEALDRLSREPVDAVVSDVLMPGMDGLGLCGAMRANAATSNVPFVFVTARSVDDAMKAEMNRIGDGSVFKPFEPRVLLDAIAAAIQKRQT